jgi:chlorophyll synthase
VNDWFDREVDAINEPHRPIPSGRMPGRWGLYLACAWTLLSILVATALGPSALVAAFAGLVLAWAYSAPPLRLKRNGWWGNAACGLCYEGLAWVTGAAVMAGGAMPESRSLNDFKSVEGDRRMGIGSLPVRLGVDQAALAACWAMALPQFGVVLLLAASQQRGYAAAVGALLALQVLMMQRFLRDPRKHAVWYSGLGVPFFVSGMLLSALALRAASAAGAGLMP